MARKTGGEDRAAALQRLKAALKTGDVGNFYVFFGEEAFLKEHYWRMLEKKLLDGPAAEFNFHRFNAETLSPQALSEAVDAMPMMAERTLIRVDDVDFFQAGGGRAGAVSDDLCRSAGILLPRALLRHGGMEAERDDAEAERGVPDEV